MDKYDEVGRIYKKRTDYSGAIIAVIVVLLLLASCVS